MVTPFRAYLDMYFQDTDDDFLVVVMEDDVLKLEVIFPPLLSKNRHSVFPHHR